MFVAFCGRIFFKGSICSNTFCVRAWLFMLVNTSGVSMKGVVLGKGTCEGRGCEVVPGGVRMVLGGVRLSQMV